MFTPIRAELLKNQIFNIYIIDYSSGLLPSLRVPKRGLSTAHASPCPGLPEALRGLPPLKPKQPPKTPTPPPLPHPKIRPSSGRINAVLRCSQKHQKKP